MEFSAVTALCCEGHMNAISALYRQNVVPLFETLK
jgi:hypothetical protein